MRVSSESLRATLRTRPEENKILPEEKRLPFKSEPPDRDVAAASAQVEGKKEISETGSTARESECVVTSDIDKDLRDQTPVRAKEAPMR